MLKSRPFHFAFHSNVTMPIGAPMVAKRTKGRLDLSKIKVTAVMSTNAAPKPVLMSAQDAIALSVAELTALYVPLDFLAHPAMPGILTMLTVCAAIAKAVSQGNSDVEMDLTSMMPAEATPPATNTGEGIGVTDTATGAPL